ncbi:MAG: SRPBCC domain-containing protein [Chloroflexota bacterium]
MDQPQADTFLNMRRTFSAPRDLVFRTWTEPKALEGWFRPMGSRQTKVVTLDLRVGGGYQFEITDGDGSLSEISGSYLEIARPEKLVFTWRTAHTDEQDTLVTLRFIEHGSTTEVVLNHARFVGEQMLKAHQAGWNWMLEQLKTVF